MKGSYQNNDKHMGNKQQISLFSFPPKQKEITKTIITYKSNKDVQTSLAQGAHGQTILNCLLLLFCCLFSKVLCLLCCCTALRCGSPLRSAPLRCAVLRCSALFCAALRCAALRCAFIGCIGSDSLEPWA